MRKIFIIFILTFCFSCKQNNLLENFTTKEKNENIFLKSVDKIRLLSYPTRSYWDTVKGSRINERISFKNNEPIISKSNIVDDIELNETQKKDFFVLLEDSICEEVGSQAACYEPRHIFLLYSKEKIVDFYEICIECGGWDCSKNMETLPNFCIEKGALFLQYFKKLKIKNLGEKTDIIKQKEIEMLKKIQRR